MSNDDWLGLDENTPKKETPVKKPVVKKPVVKPVAKPVEKKEVKPPKVALKPEPVVVEKPVHMELDAAKVISATPEFFRQVALMNREGEYNPPLVYLSGD